MRVSVSRGRCGPCCSQLPSGTASIGRPAPCTSRQVRGTESHRPHATAGSRVRPGVPGRQRLEQPLGGGAGSSTSGWPWAAWRGAGGELAHPLERGVAVRRRQGAGAGPVRAGQRAGRRRRSAPVRGARGSSRRRAASTAARGARRSRAVAPSTEHTAGAVTPQPLAPPAVEAAQRRATRGRRPDLDRDQAERLGGAEVGGEVGGHRAAAAVERQVAAPAPGGSRRGAGPGRRHRSRSGHPRAGRRARRGGAGGERLAQDGVGAGGAGGHGERPVRPTPRRARSAHSRAAWSASDMPGGAGVVVHRAGQGVDLGSEVHPLQATSGLARRRPRRSTRRVRSGGTPRRGRPRGSVHVMAPSTLHTR